MAKKPTPERLQWLEFRDAFVTKQTELKCKYCEKLLYSDVPYKVLKKPKERFYKRIKNIPKDLIATVDHVIPLSKGGEKFNESNLVICCPECNTSKSNKLLDEWLTQRNNENTDAQGTEDNSEPETVCSTGTD